MSFATQIIRSTTWGEIIAIYLEGDEFNGYYTKEEIFDILKTNPKCMCVCIPPYPALIPVTRKGKKTVRSVPDPFTHDNLLSLPQF